MRARCWLIAAFLCGCVAVGCTAAAAAEEPRASEVLQEMRQARLDPAQVYKIRELNLYREELRLYLLDGVVAFLEPVRGKVTGAVFVGQGEVLLIPPDAVERRSMAGFTGSPVLDEHFSSALLRFTDDTYRELREAIQRCSSCEAVQNRELLQNWNPVVGNLHGVNELRVLEDLLAARPVPFLAVRVSGDRLGVFDVVFDQRQPEQLVAGQSNVKDERRFSDLWCSFTVRSARGREPAPDPLLPVLYRLESRILPSRTLQGNAEVELLPAVAGERVFAFELSRYLKVSAVQLLPPGPQSAGARPLDIEFYQNPLVDEQQLLHQGNDQVTVVLPGGTLLNQRIRLRFLYEGEVISDAGNGVMFVGARGSWYPHRGSSPARFDLTFYCPRRLTLVATGDRLEDKEDGEWRVSRWSSPIPVRVAGFNLGEYEKGEARSSGVAIEVYANKNLEPGLERQRVQILLPAPPPVPPPGTAAAKNVTPPALPLAVPVVVPLPSPAEIAARIAKDTAQNLDFYSRAFGLLPLHRIAISPIPGNFGQGWPGLVYVSTRAFLVPFQEARFNASRAEELYYRTALRSHELAHQWWGNLVAPASYRDEWLIEALANYSALMYIASLRGGDSDFRMLLDSYREELLQKVEDEPGVQAGPPVLGYRLTSSRYPHGVDLVMYKKGAWIIHMLRQLMRDPKTGSDSRFTAFLAALVQNFSQRPLTTDRFRELAERFVVPAVNLESRPSLEWFFDQWVYSTGIPEVRVRSAVEKKAAKIQVRGTVTLSGVDEGFCLPVPIYAQTARGQTLVGVVSAIGQETAFSFTLATEPQRILVDPQNTLLAVFR